MSISTEEELKAAEIALEFYGKKNSSVAKRLTKERTSSIDFLEKMLPAGPGESARSIFDLLFRRVPHVTKPEIK